MFKKIDYFNSEQNILVAKKIIFLVIYCENGKFNL